MIYLISIAAGMINSAKFSCNHYVSVEQGVISDKWPISRSQVIMIINAYSLKVLDADTEVKKNTIRRTRKIKYLLWLTDIVG